MAYGKQISGVPAWTNAGISAAARSIIRSFVIMVSSCFELGASEDEMPVVHGRLGNVRFALLGNFRNLPTWRRGALAAFHRTLNCMRPRRARRGSSKTNRR